MKKITLKEFLLKFYIPAFIIQLLLFKLISFLNLDFLVIIIPILTVLISNYIFLRNNEINIVGPVWYSTQKSRIKTGLFTFHYYYIFFIIIGIIQYIGVFNNIDNVFKYFIGAILGYIVAKRQVENKISKVKENFCQYEFKEFNDKEIISFLKEKNINYTGYLFGSDEPTISTEIAIYGRLRKNNNYPYLIVFNKEYIYMFRLFGKFNIKIQDFITLKLSDVEYFKTKNLIGLLKKIEIHLNNKQRLNLQLTEKTPHVSNQEENIKKLISLIESTLNNKQI